ncbi:MAG: hypothetical protein EAX96_12855 [Candidatus Lokiarchaeota archaeon]|nr:hypothetical protein [Candidatus Lokiarchaeota archaeon]
MYLIPKPNEKFSEIELNNLKSVLEQAKVTFATVDKDLTELNAISLMKPLEGNLPLLYEVGMPLFAKGYLQEEIDRRKDQIMELEEELMDTDKNSFKGQNLESWIAYLKDEIKELEKKLNYHLRNQWVVKKILDIVKNFNEENQVLMHFTPKKFIPGLKKIFDDLDIPVEIIDITKQILSPIQIMN